MRRRGSGRIHRRADVIELPHPDAEIAALAVVPKASRIDADVRWKRRVGPQQHALNQWLRVGHDQPVPLDRDCQRDKAVQQEVSQAFAIHFGPFDAEAHGGQHAFDGRSDGLPDRCRIPGRLTDDDQRPVGADEDGVRCRARLFHLDGCRQLVGVQQMLESLRKKLAAIIRKLRLIDADIQIRLAASGSGTTRGGRRQIGRAFGARYGGIEQLGRQQGQRFARFGASPSPVETGVIGNQPQGFGQRLAIRGRFRGGGSRVEEQPFFPNCPGAQE